MMAIATLFSITLFAQQKTENCPRGGQENCTGICGRFTDENKDGYCDYSKLTSSKNLETDKARDEKIKAEKKQRHQANNVQKEEHKCKHGEGNCKKAEGEKSCCKNKQATENKQCSKDDKKCAGEKKDCCKDKK